MFRFLPISVLRIFGDTPIYSDWCSLRSCRSSSVNFFLNFGRGICREFWREFCGIFGTHKIQAQTFRGKFPSLLREKIRSSKKIFVPTLFCKRATLTICSGLFRFVFRTDQNKSSKPPFSDTSASPRSLHCEPKCLERGRAQETLKSA